MNLPALHQPPPPPALPGLIPPDPRPWQDDEPVTLAMLMVMLRRRRGVFWITLLACLLLALGWTMALPRIYRSSADVVILTHEPDVAPGDDDAADPPPTRSEDVETRIQLIRSRDMAGQVLDRAGLLDSAAFRADVLRPPSVHATIAGLLGMGAGSDRAGPVAPDRLRGQAIAFLIDRLTVERVGNSWSLRITFSDTDPARAARIADAYARLFVTDAARRQAQANKVAAGMLQDGIDRLGEQANRAYAAVQAYRVRTGLLSAAATSLAEQEISTYSQQIASARAEASRDAAALASARGQWRTGGADSVGEAAAAPVISALRSQRAQLVIRERDLSQRYFDDNPDLVTTRRQIADLDRQIAAEVNRTLRGLETRAQASARRLSSLTASLGGARARLGADNGALVRLADLEKRAQAAQSQFEAYLQRNQAVIGRRGMEQPGARLISAATVPAAPDSPDVALNLALGLVIGLLAGALLAIGTEYSYRGLTTLDDVEERLGLRGLGFVPDCSTVEPPSRDPLDCVRDHPDAGFAEALRNVIVSIRQAAPASASMRGRGRVVAVTSPIPGEGKSTLAACMGRALAMAGERVVLVDCDVARGSVARHFGIAADAPGLHDALHSDTGEAPLHREADSPLLLLPITHPFARGERLAERGRLHRVVGRLREECDVLILDCPPLLPVADAREIVALADCVVLVVRWRVTLDKVVIAAIRQLPARMIRQTAVVLNRVDVRRQMRFGGGDPASFYQRYRYDRRAGEEA